jgi:hypothetical protein
MSGIVVGVLTINLEAETASFSRAMDQASHLAAKSANDIKRSLEKVAAVGLAMGAAIATGTAALIEGSLDAADKLGKLAQATGTTAETLSVLSYAGKLAGVETEQLGKGLEKLSQAAFKAQNGNQGLQNIFGRLGVSAVDSNGHLKDSGILMEQLAVKFAGIGDSSGKTALAMALFGKSGAALIPLLNQYGSEQERVNDEAHRFGLVLNTSTVEIAAKAHDNLDRLQEVLRGVGFAVLGATLPALTDLSEKLVDIAKEANIPDLAKAFGDKVVTAVTVLGNALEFAERHAHALKIALEGLAGLAALRIAIPVIGDLQAGGIANVGKGLDRLTIGMLGLQRTLPVLAKFGAWASETAQFVGLLATEEGLASAATYVLGGAFVAVGGWVGIAVGAVAGLSLALYKFRDANIEVAGSTYKLRDTWSAAGIVISKAFGSLATDVETHLANIRKYWTQFTTWFSSSPILSELSKLAGGLLDVEKRFAELQLRFAESFIPKFAIDALNQAKEKRETEDRIRPFLGLIKVPEKPAAPKPPAETASLGKAQKDPYAEEIRKLDEAIAAQKAYLAVLDGTPEQIAEVSAAEKAQGIILQLNNRLMDEGKPLLTALQQATIGHRVAIEESTKSLVDYGKELVGQQHSAQLSIQQTRAMAAANLEGDAAVRTASIDNAILALRFNRVTGEIMAMTPELEKLRAQMTENSSTNVLAGANKQVDSLRDELTQRQLISAATLGSIDAQRRAELTSKVFKLDENIADPKLSADAVDALKKQRDAVIALTQAEWAEQDAQAARSLLSPDQEYERSTDSLNHAVEALKELQGGTLTYTQQLGIAAKQQDEFNKATDGTIELLLREGSLGDGVTAFFLKMQEGAKTAAETIFETMNEMFNKLSDNLTQLITAPNRFARKDAINAFATSFENIGKNLLDSQIKVQLQGALGGLGKAFGITPKIDGSSSQNALWVRWATANGSPAGAPGGSTSAAGSVASAGGNELDNLLGVPPSPQHTFSSVQSGAGQVASVLGSATQGQPGPLGVAGGILSTLSKLFGLKQPARQSGGVLGGETLGLPTLFGSMAPDGGNELSNLTGDIPPAVQSIPTLLRRTPESETGLTAGEDAASVIPQAPDVQPKTYTLITRPHPSALSGILSTVLGLGTKLLGGMGGGGGAGADAAGSAASSVTDAATSSASDVSDFSGFMMAGGGRVSGPGSGTSDSIPARLSHGEFVTKAAQTAKYLPLLHRINNDTLPRFAAGGILEFSRGGLTVPRFASGGLVGSSYTVKMPHFALGGIVGFEDGGFVSPDAAYAPASSDYSTMSNASNRISSSSASSSHSSVGGDTHHWDIHIPPGANDPAQMTAHLDRYMLKAGPQIAAMALHAVKDQQLRRAPSAR